MSKTGTSMKMKNAPHPGFSVRVDCLEPHGLSVTEGAKVLDVSRSALSHLVNENADLSWDMSIRLAKAFIMHNNETGPTLLELLLQLERDIRGRLELIRVTALQAGVLYFLCLLVVLP